MQNTLTEDTKPSQYVFYICDIETTGLDAQAHDTIELSLLRLGDDSDNAQKTWCFKPLSPDTIDLAALRINGHLLPDLLHQTKEGRERYLEPNKVLVEIENWLASDDMPAEKRFLVGQNISFDKVRLENLWSKCGCKESFPFGRRVLDSMVIELAIDYARGEFAEGYSLKNIAKKYGVVNSKAHTAAADVMATKQVFEKQIDFLKGLLSK